MIFYTHPKSASSAAVKPHGASILASVHPSVTALGAWRLVVVVDSHGTAVVLSLVLVRMAAAAVHTSLQFGRYCLADRGTGRQRGTGRIHNIEQIDRGYQNIEQRLTALSGTYHAY